MLRESHLTPDLYENVMYNLDIDTLGNFCSIKHIKCESFDFWVNKFKYDNLPILASKLPSKQLDWINEFKKTSASITKTNYIIDKLSINNILILEFKYNSDFGKIVFPFISSEKIPDIINAPIKQYILYKDGLYKSYLHICGIPFNSVLDKSKIYNYLLYLHYVTSYYGV